MKPSKLDGFELKVNLGDIFAKSHTNWLVLQFSFHDHVCAFYLIQNRISALSNDSFFLVNFHVTLRTAMALTSDMCHCNLCWRNGESFFTIVSTFGELLPLVFSFVKSCCILYAFFLSYCRIHQLLLYFNNFVLFSFINH